MAIKVLVKDGKLATYGGKAAQVDITLTGGTDSSLGITGAPVGQIVSIKSVDSNGSPTEFTAVNQSSASGEQTTVVEDNFKIWGKDATNTAENDIILSTANGYYDKTTGKLVATSVFCSNANLVEITDNTTIYCKNLYDFSAGYAISYFDESKNIISGIGGTGNTSTRITGTQTIPTGTKYVGVSLLIADPSMYVEFTIRKTIVVNSLQDRVNSLENSVSTLQNQASSTTTLDYAALSACINRGYYDTNGVFQLSDGWRCTDYIPVSEGDILTVKLTTYNTVTAIAYFDSNKKFISGIVGDAWSWSTTVYPLTGEQIVPANTYFVRVSVFIADYANAQYVTITQSIIRKSSNAIDVINGLPLKVLILGDSYSAMGHWIRGMQEVINVKSLVNLAVTSATVKDRYSDRNTYPYSDRPTSTGSGNTNTLSSQIQKLKRLMKGTDLDSGEQKLYENVNDYPDIVIIEGGMNDSPDDNDTVATYHNQFLVSKTAYYKQSASSSASQTTVWVKPPIDSIDRTCFAGAYRYICEEIFTLFPNTQIFITTASHMNYFTVDPNARYGTIAEQQRMCANIMSYTVIDWHAEGNLNTMMIGLNGSGTASDPYTPAGGDTYTTDLLHPNAFGGKRYGRLAGKVIAQRFLGFN